ncbi:MAG: hypothetical protein IPJ82_07725 [Lewinellaceae bacterium]|nr:hypothetical protein [Lewinellaceae bacterium]
MYVKGDFDEAFKFLNDAYIDANLNTAKKKYRAAGSDENKRIAARPMNKGHKRLREKARLYVMTLDYDNAVDYYRKAVFANQDEIAIRDEFANSQPHRQRLQSTYEFSKARRAFQESVDIREKLVKEDTGNEEYQYFKLLEAQNNLITLPRIQSNERSRGSICRSGKHHFKYIDFVRRDSENPDPEQRRKKRTRKTGGISFKDNDDENCSCWHSYTAISAVSIS